MNLSTSEAKILAMVIIGVGSFVIGLFPACFTRRRAERTLRISWLLCFGAGVLLGTSLLHMLPDTRKRLPLYAELLCCCGFLLLYMVDEIVHLLWGNVIDPPLESHSHQSGISYRHEFTNNLQHGHASVTRGYCHSHTGVGNPSKRHNHHNDLQVDGQVSSPCIAGTSHNAISSQASYEPNIKSNIPCVQDHSHSSYGTISEVQLPVPNAPSPCCEEEETLLCHGSHTEPCANSNTGLVGLLVALTLHTILEGLAVGLQTETSKVLLLVLAIASHKLVVSFCLGTELGIAASSFVRHAIAIGVFAGGSVVGIGIGMVVTQIEDSWVTNILMPVLQGLAGGSLLYVTVSEVLPRERARWHRTTRRAAGVVQFLSVTCGFFVMYMLNTYIGETK